MIIKKKFKSFCPGYEFSSYSFFEPRHPLCHCIKGNVPNFRLWLYAFRGFAPLAELMHRPLLPCNIYPLNFKQLLYVCYGVGVFQSYHEMLNFCIQRIYTMIH